MRSCWRDCDRRLVGRPGARPRQGTDLQGRGNEMKKLLCAACARRRAGRLAAASRRPPRPMTPTRSSSSSATACPPAGLSVTRCLGVAEQVGTIRGLGVAVVRVSGDPAAVVARARTAARPCSVRRGQQDPARPPRCPNDPRFAELYGLNNTGQTGGTRRRRHRRARGLGRGRRSARFPATGGAEGRHRRHRHPRHPRGPRRQGRQLRAVARRAADLRAARSRRARAPTTTATARTSRARSRANANNGKGVAGVAFNSPLAICKALGGPLGQGSTSDVANCITWLKDKGAQGHLDEPRRRRLDDAAATPCSTPGATAARGACSSPRPATTATRR